MENKAGIMQLDSPVEKKMSDYGKLPHISFAKTLPIALKACRLNAGILLEQQQKSCRISLRYAYRMFEEGGNFANFRIAAGLEDSDFTDRLASDSDVYKWLEAIGYELVRREDTALRSMAESVIDWIEAAQDDNGYLMTYYQVLKPADRWTDLANGHELYCAGHLFQAAVAYDFATKDGRLTKISNRLAKHIASIFGPDKRPGTSGHPEIEMALVEFYRHTGNIEYLNLAKFFVDQRGLQAFGVRDESRYQNHLPVRLQQKVVGHAVRQLYLSAGVTDVYLETGVKELLDTLMLQWRDMTEKKMYVTGGLGQRHDGEIFGESYELPSDRCYCETCAAVASIFWNWRMLLATGEARFADLIERTLYNAFLASYGQDGEHFFYVNPLQSRGPVEHHAGDVRGGWRRARWHGTACCPPNVMRLLASVDQYIVTKNQNELYIQQYIPSTINVPLDDGSVEINIDTQYPWNGNVQVSICCENSFEWTLSLRIPEWCDNANISVNGEVISPETLDGYVNICREWSPQDVVEIDFEMKPEWIDANPRIDSLRGAVALRRGPLIYCFEQCDLSDGIRLDDIFVDTSIDVEEKWREDVLDGVMTLSLTGRQSYLSGWGGELYKPVIKTEHQKTESVKLKAIPYFAWANRQPGAMRVWIPINSELSRKF